MSKKSGLCGPSDAWIDRLGKAGCPMDRTITNKLHSRGQTRPFLLRPTCGECRVFDMSHLGGTGYEIGFRIEVLRAPGLIVKEWFFTPPWSEHYVSWGLERRSPSGSWISAGEAPNDQELLAVLDDRRPVKPARPVEGWLFGQSLDSIPDDVADHSSVFGLLTVIEESGTTARMKIRLQVNRSARVEQVKTKSQRRTPLFEKPDALPHQ